MQVQVNTDKNIVGTESLTLEVESTLEAALSRFAERITRVEVHLSDENGDKTGDNDKKCVLEARPAGLRPVAVSHSAATLDQALDGAAGKLERLLESSLGRRSDAKGRVSFSGDENV